MSEPNGAQQTLTLEDLDRFVKGPVETAPDDELTRYLDAAAVLVAFNPDQLRPVGGASTEPAERETVRAGLAALSELIDDGPQRGLWSLSFAERRDGLRRLGNRERMRQALDANPERPESPVQRMFERVVNDDAFVLAHLPRDELAALITVIGWLNGIVEPLPNEAAMRSALASADHLAPMRRLADASFVDRQTQLEQIGAYALDGVDRPTPLFVFGPGGVGKSALLAKFILDSLHRENVPFVYIDLDRSTVRPDRPLTLLLEALQQLQLQLNLPLATIDPIIKEIVDASRREEIGRHYESYVGGFRLSAIIDLISSSLIPLMPSPVVVIVDTFEEAQYMGPSVARSLVHFVFLLARKLGPLRVIAAGRALPKEYVELAFPNLPSDLLASADTWVANDPLVQSIPLPVRPVNVGVLDEGPAQELLQNLIRLTGLAPLSDSEVDEVIGIVSRNPMCLNLAARLIRDQGVDKLRRARSEFLARLKAEKIQALLYGRILHHVHANDVRKVAYPGLIVRRITPDIIRDVLAGPCGLELSPERNEHQIFADLANEAALVERDPVDGSLRHRVDVRRAMLADLTDHVEPEVVERIDRLAVDFHADQAGAIARGEELYHRLRLREPESLLDERWLLDPQLALRLKGAVQELPSKQRLWLAKKLGITLPASVRQEAEQEEWEDQAAREADTLLSSGLAERALSILRERSERSPRSRLYALEAESLRFLGVFDEALSIARSGVEAASKAGATDMALELLLKMVVIEESRGRLHEAETLLNEAAAVAASTHDTMLRLRANITLLRVHRQLHPEGRDQRKMLREEVLATLTDDMLHKLRAHPVLLQEVAAELGNEDARIAELAIRALGLAVATDAQAKSLAQALTSLNTAQESEQRPPIELAKVIDQYQKNDSDPDVIREWVTKQLTRTDTRALSKAIGTYEKGSDVLKTFRDYFRSGVDSAMNGTIKE